MWRLLPVCLLVACAAHDQQAPAGDGKQAARFRIAQQIELPLQRPTPDSGGLPARKTFQGSGMQGWLDATGAWHIEGEVQHQRLRCATYELGIQPGSGNRGCSGVAWLAGVQYVTRVRHCNSAGRLHAGSGKFAETTGRLDALTCVRVRVRCQGVC